MTKKSVAPSIKTIAQEAMSMLIDIQRLGSDERREQTIQSYLEVIKLDPDLVKFSPHYAVVCLLDNIIFHDKMKLLSEKEFRNPNSIKWQMLSENFELLNDGQGVVCVLSDSKNDSLLKKVVLSTYVVKNCQDFNIGGVFYKKEDSEDDVQLGLDGSINYLDDNF